MTIGSALEELAELKSSGDGKNSSMLIDIETHLARLSGFRRHEPIDGFRDKGEQPGPDL